MAVQALDDLSLDALSTVILNERTLDLLGGHRRHVKDLIVEFGGTHKKRFIGLGDMAQNRADFGVDVAHPALWKNSQTADWEITPTGLGTFDEIITESATQSVLLDDSTIVHWAYLANILDIGSGNNLMRMHWNDINGKRYTRSTSWVPSRLGALKVYQLPAGRVFRDRGTLDLNAEFEGTGVTEVVTYAIHMFPQEILNNANLATYAGTA